MTVKITIGNKESTLYSAPYAYKRVLLEGTHKNQLVTWPANLVPLDENTLKVAFYDEDRTEIILREEQITAIIAELGVSRITTTGLLGTGYRKKEVALRWEPSLPPGAKK